MEIKISINELCYFNAIKNLLYLPVIRPSNYTFYHTNLGVHVVDLMGSNFGGRTPGVLVTEIPALIVQIL